MKVILSTGAGKLHFHETARSLAEAGVEVLFLTGWAPGARYKTAVGLLGGILGEKHLAERLAARSIQMPNVSVQAVAWPEFAARLLELVQRTHLLTRDFTYGLQFRMASLGSRSYLQNADILLVRSGAGQCGAISTARKNGLRVVTDQSLAHPAFIHEILSKEFARFGMKAGYHPNADLWKLVLRDCDQADFLLVNSHFVKETFVEQGYPAEKIRVAYLGVSEKFFGLKCDYAIQGPANILFTGNFDIRKGVRILLEAIRKCRRGGADLRLNLIGNLGNGERCLEPGDSDFFTHTPFVLPEKLALAFASADLFVFPTFAEGSSRSGMEAASAGLPIITTKNCGLPLEHGRSAMYVPVGDAEALAETLSQMLTNQALRESVGQNAMKTITENYTWDCYGQRLASILNEALDP
jgi:glycosyltransferase involved in cell wall biosynthesis